MDCSSNTARRSQDWTPLRQERGTSTCQPNGVFCLDARRRASIRRTADFSLDETVEFATQSGPMLLVDSSIDPGFTRNSPNLYVRSGVGLLPDGKVLFAISKDEMNFYDFASFFRNRGCRDALYLDGFVSQA